MIDIAQHLAAIHRAVGTGPAEGGGEEVRVVLRRTYRAPVADVWDALTDPDRVKRWFYPLSGDLRAGGSFQLEGNAGGEIRTCEPPRTFTVTFGGPTSVVEVLLSPGGDEATDLQLTHTVPIEMARSEAGALFVGPGWDGALLGLALFLQGEVVDDPIAAANSPEVREFSRGSIDAWVAVVEASGTAPADEIAAGRQMAEAQFTPAE
ncbi:uncharacterized protein YndB with AHSA1/START domain [Asanoa ferruginea]|uniref:Uncharacterized protein YndB with AHSA1/START domain n=1 Tax=Asanoa ferruginea TaxID=53367 RepID=A0A3D9ZVP1_9ACTN|nr:SRPBCC domain-containing protein [Asanoa ferruginea]REG00134.1 uncharacterized protein YndB with AHSA1/START domain [Asanoa ferruginea]GIF46171.1 activator of HSP90 ATPase [Asanoa ferruginea]